MLGGADDLIILVPFAGDQEHVFGAGAEDCRGDRLPPVRLDVKPWLAVVRAIRSRRGSGPDTPLRTGGHGAKTADDAVDDRLWAFGAQVVRVTMTTSASRAATWPICGRLPGSRSPPQPNTTIRRPRLPVGEVVVKGARSAGAGRRAPAPAIRVCA